MTSETRLRKPRQEANELLMARIDAGKELRARRIDSNAALRQLKADIEQWIDYNRRLLRNLFDTEEFVHECNSIRPSNRVALTASAGVELVKREIDAHIDVLASIRNQLELIDEPKTDLSDDTPIEQETEPMTAMDQLRIIVERLTAGTATENELKLLREAVNSGQATLATGDQAVAVGGALSNSVIITGNGNIVLHGPDATAI